MWSTIIFFVIPVIWNSCLIMGLPNYIFLFFVFLAFLYIVFPIRRMNQEIKYFLQNLLFLFHVINHVLIMNWLKNFPQILRTLFEVVLLEDRGNQWSLSRAILSMILISEEVMTILLLLCFILIFVSILFQML